MINKILELDLQGDISHKGNRLLKYTSLVEGCLLDGMDRLTRRLSGVSPGRQGGRPLVVRGAAERVRRVGWWILPGHGAATRDHSSWQTYTIQTLQVRPLKPE